MQVQHFLEAFVEEFGLRDLIQFSTRVVEVSPLDYTVGQQACSNGLCSNGEEPLSISPQWVITTELLPGSDLQVLQVFSARQMLP